MEARAGRYPGLGVPARTSTTATAGPRPVPAPAVPWTMGPRGPTVIALDATTPSFAPSGAPVPLTARGHRGFVFFQFKNQSLRFTSLYFLASAR